MNEIGEYVRELEAANQRLREAIADALADLTPGYSPYGLLRDALDKEDSR